MNILDSSQLHGIALCCGKLPIVESINPYNNTEIHCGVCGKKQGVWGSTGFAVANWNKTFNGDLSTNIDPKWKWGQFDLTFTYMGGKTHFNRSFVNFYTEDALPTGYLVRNLKTLSLMNLSGVTVEFTHEECKRLSCHVSTWNSCGNGIKWYGLTCDVEEKKRGIKVFQSMAEKLNTVFYNDRAKSNINDILKPTPFYYR
jgi:hypothetical protein